MWGVMNLESLRPSPESSHYASETEMVDERSLRVLEQLEQLTAKVSGIAENVAYLVESQRSVSASLQELVTKGGTLPPHILSFSPAPQPTDSPTNNVDRSSERGTSVRVSVRDTGGGALTGSEQMQMARGSDSVVRLSSSQPRGGSSSAPPGTVSLMMGLTDSTVDPDAPWPTNIPPRRQATNRSLKRRNTLTGIGPRIKTMGTGLDGDDNTLLLAKDWKPARVEENKWALHPNSLFRAILDICSLLVLGYDMIFIPVILAWDLTGGAVQAMGWVSPCFWSIDMFFTCLTGYYVNGELEMRPRKIVSHYVRTWFPMDLLVLVVDWVGVALNASSGSSDLGIVEMSVRTLKLGRVLRLLSLVRMLQLSYRLEKLIDTFLSDTTRMISYMLQITFLILWVSHVFCCVWYVIGMQKSSDTGYNWVNLYVGSHNQVLNSDPEIGQYRSQRGLYQYMTAYHWSISHLLGSGIDVTAGNSLERASSIICLLCGLLVLSSLVALCSAALVEIQTRRQDHVTKLTTLRRFLRENDISHRVSGRVQEQVKERLSSKKRLIEKDVGALVFLSTRVRQELTSELYKPALLEHPLLRLFDLIDGGAAVTMISDACVQMLALQAGDALFQSGDDAAAVYIISQGGGLYTPALPVPTLKRQSDQNLSKHVRSNSVNTLQSSSSQGGNAYVEKGVWLSEAAFFCHWTHVGTLITPTDSQILMVDVAQSLEVLSSQDLIQDIFRRYAAKFHSQVIHSKPPRSKYPDDLAVAFTTYTDLMCAMPNHVQLFTAQVLLQTTHFAAIRHDEILEDVQNEHYSLVYTQDLNLVRVCAFASLQISNWDGHVLVCFGKMEGDKLVRACAALPSVRRVSGEAPEIGWEHILEELGPLSSGIELTGTITNILSSWSPGTSLLDITNHSPEVPLKIMQTVRQGTISNESWENIDVLFAQNLPTSQRHSKRRWGSWNGASWSLAPDRTEIFNMQRMDTDEKDRERPLFNINGKVYGWLPLSEYLAVKNKPVDINKSFHISPSPTPRSMTMSFSKRSKSVPKDSPSQSEHLSNSQAPVVIDVRQSTV